MADDKRTNLKEEALTVLKESFRSLLDNGKNFSSSEIVTSAFIEQIFDCAWSNQFRDDPSKFKREMRKIIRHAAGSNDEI